MRQQHLPRWVVVWCMFVLVLDSVEVSATGDVSTFWPPEVLCDDGFADSSFGNQTITERCFRRVSVEQAGEGTTPYPDDQAYFYLFRAVLPRRSRIADIGRAFHSLVIVVRTPLQHTTFLRSKQRSMRCCLLRNGTSPLAPCSGAKAVSEKGMWVRETSPFTINVVQIQVEGSDKPPENLSLSISEVFRVHFVAFFLVGLLFMATADIGSRMVVLYYGIGAIAGIFLVLAVLAFQTMRLLNLTRGSAKVFLGGAFVVGLGSFLWSYVSGLAAQGLEWLGMGDSFVSPVAVMICILVLLSGAFMGFQVVRKFVLTPSGGLDAATIYFVRTATYVSAGCLLLLSSSDQVFGCCALALGVCVASGSVYLPGVVERSFAGVLQRRNNRSSGEGAEEAEVPGTPVREASRWQNSSPSQFLGQQHQDQQAAHSPASALDASPMLQQPLLSTFHRVENRRAMTPQQYAVLTQDCTRRALADLYHSPAMGVWLARNQERVFVTPTRRREHRSDAEICSTATMEAGFDADADD